MGTVALHAQMKNAPHHSGGFFIQGPVVLVLWGFPVVLTFLKKEPQFFAFMVIRN